MKKYCIYVLVFPNNKKYFGMTSKNIKNRWQNGTGYAKNKQFAIYNAIQKYKWENIDKFVLIKDLDFEQANDLEKFFIKTYKTNYYTYKGKYGYNLTDGGKGTIGHKLSEESKELMRIKNLGRTGKDCPNSKVVLCENKEYESLTIFCETFGLQHQTVSSWLIGKKSMPKEWFDKGLRYKYYNYNIRCQKIPHKRKIYCDGKIYDSLSSFSKYINISAPRLSKILNGKVLMPKELKEKDLKYIT